MNAENEKSKMMKRIQLESQANAKRILVFQEIISEVGKGIKMFADYGREMRETDKKQFVKYFNSIKISINSLNDPSQICQFLLGEKGILNEKIIEANLNENGFDRKFYQEKLDKIIEPLLNHWKDELEFQKTKPKYNQLEVTQNNVAPPKPLEAGTEKETVDTITELPTGFSQIECNATKEQIEFYFMILAKERNILTGEFFMTKDAVIKFIHKNFSIFNEEPNGIYFPISLIQDQKGILRHFMYWFYVTYDQKAVNTKIKYANLLRHNFELFESDKPAIIMSNMSESKKPKKGAIKIDKYFPK